jgi:hypothetical protein
MRLDCRRGLFTLYAARAIVSGGAGQVIDLAKSNIHDPDHE